MIRGLLKKLFGNFSLEVKFLLAFGIALVVALVAAFYVVQGVAERLVMQTTRQAARDYAVSVILSKHYQIYATPLDADANPSLPDSSEVNPQESLLTSETQPPVGTAMQSPQQTVDMLSALLLQSSYRHELMRLDDSRSFDNLGGSVSRSTSEQGLLSELFQRMNNAFATSHPVENRLENSLGDASHLEQPRNVVVPLAREESGPSESGPLDRNADFVADSPPPPQPMASQDTPAPRTPAPKTLAPKTLAPKTLAPTETAVEISVPLNDEPAGFALDTPLNSHQLFDEAGPVDGLYYYYYPIEFHDQCLACHSQISTPAGRPQLNERSLANGESPRLTAVGAVRPNRVIRVQMDYSDTKVWTLWSFSILTTLGIATLGLTLFIVHWLLRRMVILPVSHLRDVSNSISKGQMDQRAQLDTGDELNELSDAFNRMLRYINETQGQLTTVNAELDSRVDQLAHANLQLFEANRLKSDFLANMSHELRTPLNSILGFSEVLQAFDTLNDKQKKYAANIQKSGRLLLEMINDILDLAKVEAGKMDVRPTHFNVSSVAEGQCDVVRGLAEEKKIDLRFESTDADAMIYQDQPKIQQILTNLLSNAIKFTPDGGMITVSVDTRNESQCVLTVTDSGVGIPPAEIDVVFEKFRQSRAVLQHDGLTREYSGTGLGLSIVKEISRLLGGEVVVESDVGKGSKFSVYLDAHYQPNLDRSQRISLPVPGLNDSPPTLI